MRILSFIAIPLVCVAFLAGCDNNSDQARLEPHKVSLSTPIQSSDWGQQGTELTTKHYRIFTTCSGSRINIALPGFMEAAYLTYCELADARANSTKMPMYMLNSRSQWSQMTRTLFGSHGPDGVIENGGYTFRGVTVCWNIGRLATFSVASHEGMHQFLYYHFRDRLPLWAEEGLATQCEGFVMGNAYVRFTPDNNMMRLVDLRKAMHSGGWLGIRELLVATSRKRLGQGETFGLGYYGQLYVLTRMLRSNPEYAPRWEKLLADTRTGKLREVLNANASKMPAHRYYNLIAVKAFEKYITSDLDRFETEFRKYAQQLIRYDGGTDDN